jgi:hypothetical protein
LASHFPDHELDEMVKSGGKLGRKAEKYMSDDNLTEKEYDKLEKLAEKARNKDSKKGVLEH